MSKSFYVYRFKNSFDQVIYVGKTKEKLVTRFKNHKHLPDECYRSVERIEYISCQSESDMSIKEIYYINRYCHENHISYNIAEVTAPTEEIDLNDKWIFYDGFLPKWFSSSINVRKGYKEKKEKRYKKDGSIKKTASHRKSGYNYNVYPLTDEEAHIVQNCLVKKYQNAPNKENEQIVLRNLLIFMTGIQYPLKISTLLGLKYKDIFDENDRVKPLIYQANRTFKDYQFVFHLDNSLKYLYQFYRTKYGLTYDRNSEDSLFLSREKKVLSVGSYNYSLTGTVKDAGIEKNVGGETLRKTYGLHIYNKCADKIRALDYLEIVLNAKGYGEIGKYLCLIDKDFDYSIFLTKEYEYFGNDEVYSEVRKIPASYYRNTELMTKDRSNPLITPQQIQKNLEGGKYYISDGDYARLNNIAYYNSKKP